MVASDCVKTKTMNGKKVSKPLMEKKRRARINKCLDQLKYLLENYYTNNIRKRKLEKADILELTVKHLRNLQKIQSESSMNSGLSDYQAGFRNCLAGVNQYLLMADNSNGSSRLSMLAHLSSNLLCTGDQALNSSTADSDSGSQTAQDATVQRLLSTAEVNKTSLTVSLAHCLGSFKPHNSSRVSHSQSSDINGGRLSVGNGQMFTTAYTKTTQEKIIKRLCQNNKDHPIVQCNNEVIGILDVWRPW